jgi:hypothetical protein
MDMEDMKRLACVTKRLNSSVKRRDKLSEKLSSMDYTTHTQKAIGNASANLNWECMELAKLELEAHSICVDCGLAAPRHEKAYGEHFFDPSGWHKYSYTPPMPRIVAERIKYAAKSEQA